jgi:3-oxoacyl-[acyl-carrier-protein] synthase-3
MHTAALAAAFDGQVERLAAGTQLLFVVAGAGVTAGAALYRQPPRIGNESERG